MAKVRKRTWTNKSGQSATQAVCSPVCNVRHKTPGFGARRFALRLTRPQQPLAIGTTSWRTSQNVPKVNPRSAHAAPRPPSTLADQRRAARAVLNELFTNYGNRIHTRHYWGLRSINEKRGLNSWTKEDCRVAMAAAAYYRESTGPIPEYKDWLNGGRDGQ